MQSFSGDNGPATAATLNNPTWVMADSSGNIYISDQFNQRVRMVNTSGIITTIAGNGTAAFAGDNGPATSASLNYPGGLALDPAGSLFIVDPNNNRVRKVSGGIITTVAGNGTPGFGGDNGPPLSAEFNNPFALALDSLGKLYVGDITNDRVREITGVAAASGTGTGYPYYFSDFAVGTFVAGAGGYQTTLTYINYGTQSVTCTTKFYGDSGAALAIPFAQGTISTRVDVLPPGGSVHDQTTANLSAPGAEGWAQASCTGPVEASLLYRLYQSGTAVGEASVNAETTPTSKFVTFAQASAAGSTGVAYANPSTTQPATVTITAYNTGGVALGSNTVTLQPMQHGASNVNGISANFTGSIAITSTSPIISLSLNAEVSPVFSSLPPGDLSASPPTGAQTYYFSDLAVGTFVPGAGGYQSTLTYVNYTAQAVTCVTTFYLDSGSPWQIAFTQGTISTRTDMIPPGGSVHDQTVANISAPGQEGWAQASCTGPVEAGLLYRLYQSGTPVGEASVNAETAPTTEFATFAQTATGVAYANPSTTQSALITFAAFSATGTFLASKVITLGPLAHSAANLAGAASLLGLGSFSGFVEITSTVPIISLSLNAEAFPVFSSLPPGDLPGSTTLVAP